VRIVLVDPGAYTPPYDDRLATALAARGHDVHLLTAPFRFGDAPPAKGYRRDEVFFGFSSSLFRRSPRSSLRLPLKAIEYLPGTVRLRRRVEELDPDVVHFQWLVHRPDVDLRWLRPVASRRATVFTAHDLWAMLGGRPAAWLRIFDEVDRVVVHSRRAAAELPRRGVAPERVVRIPHPVFSAARPAEPTRDGHTLLSFGLIRAYKGIDLLLEALPEIERAVPDVRLVIAGDSHDAVGPFRVLSDRLGVADRVEWRLGFHPEVDIESLMASTTAVVLPYRRWVDSSGVLATALGHGVPVVATDVGNLGETVEEFGAGEVVPPEDVGALAGACVRLLTDVGARERAEAGALAARKELTWEHSAELHERLYRSIAEPRPVR
jgi:glycosyltransferase involved in cell wall biosynthesis